MMRIKCLGITVCLVCMLLLSSHSCANAAASSQLKGAVILNPGVVPNQDAVDLIAERLKTKVDKPTTKAAMLREMKTADILYLNTHMYSAEWHHPYDKYWEKLGGSIGIGDVSFFTGANPKDVATIADVKAAANGNPPALTILAGCSADPYGWNSAFAPGTLIDFTGAIPGNVADAYFANFFDAWINKGMTLSEALADADAVTAAEPHNGAFKVSLVDMISKRRVHGNSALKYADIKPKPYNLNGVWQAVGYSQGAARVRIEQRGTEIKAVKITGSTFIPAGRTTWEGTYEPSTNSVSSARGQWAEDGYKNPKWVEVKVIFKDNDSLKVSSADEHWPTLEMTRIE